MSFAQARQEVEQLIIENWDSTTTPIQLSNVTGLIQGTSRPTSSDGLSQWIRVDVVNSDANQADMNTNIRVRVDGFIDVKVFVKVGVGHNRADTLADAVVTLLQLRTLNPFFSTKVANVIDVGQVKDTSFYQVSVKIPFYRDSFQH